MQMHDHVFHLGIVNGALREDANTPSSVGRIEEALVQRAHRVALLFRDFDGVSEGFMEIISRN